jgi:hypothetical protein
VTVTDALGVDIEVGDIIMSASKGAVFKIGRVETVAAKSGRIGMKFAEKVSVFAYERGAPDIETKGTRVKRDENGNAVYEDGGPPDTYNRFRLSSYRPYAYEDYTYFRKDYTKVDTRWRWKKEQAAWSSVLVLRKHDWTGLGELHKLMNLDYDGTTPDMG